MSSPQATSLQVTSNDGQTFTLTPGMIDQSGYFTCVARMPAEVQNRFSLLAEVDGATLKVIFDWLKHHETDSRKKKNRMFRCGDTLPAWDAAYLDRFDNDQYWKLLNASKPLKINRLMLFVASLVAGALKGRSTAEMCAIMRVKSDEETELEELDA